MIELTIRNGFDEFRTIARDLMARGVQPSEVSFCAAGEEASLSLWSERTEIRSPATPIGRSPATLPTVSQKFLELARALAHHSSPRKWQLLYRLLWRQSHENKHLLEIAVDPDVDEALRMQKAVQREIHKVHAFVRFKKITDPDERYVAWIETEHPVLELAAPFFMRRFGDKPWSILTPLLCAHWDCEKLEYTDGVAQAPSAAESLDDLWSSYYRSTFNPARVNIRAMKKEMPVRYWAALPEAKVIDELIRETPDRLRKMARGQNDKAEVPATRDWSELKRLASACRACPLGNHATQTVFGEGPTDARVMIIGEQPGDQEDQTGRAFVGPAGEVLNRALERAGLDRSKIYLTNAVKHFKWKPGPPGKPRLHQKPSGAESHACRPWLERELEIVRPGIIVCLGQTAATTLFGRMVKISEEAGRVHRDLPWASQIIVTYHPSAILRAPSAQEAEEMQADLVRALSAASATQMVSGAQ